MKTKKSKIIRQWEDWVSERDKKYEKYVCFMFSCLVWSLLYCEGYSGFPSFYIKNVHCSLHKETVAVQGSNAIGKKRGGLSTSSVDYDSLC